MVLTLAVGVIGGLGFEQGFNSTSPSCRKQNGFWVDVFAHFNLVLEIVARKRESWWRCLEKWLSLYRYQLDRNFVYVDGEPVGNDAVRDGKV
jgi:hypothetical protein